MQNQNLRALIADIYHTVERYEAPPPDPAQLGDSALASYWLELAAYCDALAAKWAEDPEAHPLAVSMLISLVEWKNGQSKPAVTKAMTAKAERHQQKTAATLNALS